ncbi:hypothetical protein SANTM175S_00189 [Streptomyces antimycoticus]
MRQRGPGEHERGRQIDPQYTIPFGVVGVRDRREAVHDAGVVDQHVQAAELLHGRGDDLVHHPLVDQVADHGPGRAPLCPYGRDDTFNAVPVEVRDQHPRPLPGERQGGGPADSRSRPGDDDAMTLESGAAHVFLSTRRSVPR